MMIRWSTNILTILKEIKNGQAENTQSYKIQTYDWEIVLGKHSTKYTRQAFYICNAFR